MKRTLSALAALLVLGVAFASAPAAAQDLSRYVAIGDSLTHAVMNGCAVKLGQTDSYPALIARAAGVDFQQPLIDTPGLAASPLTGCQTLVNLTPTFAVQPSTGKQLNSGLTRPFNNLGVNGFNVSDVINKKGDTPAGLTDTVLRGGGTALAQAASLKPTFVTVWIGNNDELQCVTGGLYVDGVMPTSRAAFKASYDTILKTLVAAQGGVASGVVFTLPDPTAVPFATKIPQFNGTTPGVGVVLHKSGPYAGTPWRYTGNRDNKEIPFGSIVNLSAAGYLKGAYGGIPYGIACGMLDDAGYPATGALRAVCDKFGLPEGKIDLTTGVVTPGVVLYGDNVVKLQTRLAEFNTDIRALAATYGYKVFDANAVFADISAHGRDYGGMLFSSDYLTGGIFGYDGVHPLSAGHAVLADEFVQFYNSVFTHPLPRPNMASILLNGNTSGGWFPLPQGASMSFEETLAVASQIFTGEFRAGVAASIRVPELQMGDSGAPETGARDVVRDHTAVIR